MDLKEAEGEASALTREKWREREFGVEKEERERDLGKSEGRDFRRVEVERKGAGEVGLGWWWCEGEERGGEEMIVAMADTLRMS